VRVQIMPLMIRDGRLVIALDDPVRRRATVEEIEFITQMKTVPVLAQCLSMGATLAATYEKFGSAGARLSLNVMADPIPFEVHDTGKCTTPAS
jgi:hypothetical protein